MNRIAHPRAPPLGVGVVGGVGGVVVVGVGGGVGGVGGGVAADV